MVHMAENLCNIYGAECGRTLFIFYTCTYTHEKLIHFIYMQTCTMLTRRRRWLVFALSFAFTAE